MSKAKLRASVTRCVLFLAIWLGLYTPSMANHLLGGEMHYEYLGGDSFRVTLNLYADIVNGSRQAISLDSTITIGVFKDGEPDQALEVSGNALETPVEGHFPKCLSYYPKTEIRKFTYTTVASFPNGDNEYVLAFQRCCRPANLSNLQDAEITGITIWTKIPPRSQFGSNSSPEFNQDFPSFICLGDSVTFDQSASDADGDSLVYDIIAPYAGTSEVDPRPHVPRAPPYFPVKFGQFYNKASLLGKQSHFSINSETGEVLVKASRIGNFAVGVRVKEYRKGVLIGETFRDFQVLVGQCLSKGPMADFYLPKQACGLKVAFTNTGLDTSLYQYSWDFGDPTVSSDVSSAHSPVYTFQKHGDYRIKLTLKTDSCEASMAKWIRLERIPKQFAGVDKHICAEGDTAVLGDSIHKTGYKYYWAKSKYLNDTAIGNPKAFPDKNTRFYLTKEFGYCYQHDTVEVLVGPPIADFTSRALPECRNGTYQLKYTGQRATEFLWTLSNAASPTTKNTYATFSSNGSKSIKLKVVLNGKCHDSVVKKIDVKMDHTASFAGGNRLIALGDSTQLGTQTQYLQAKFAWWPKKNLSDSTVSNPICKPGTSTWYYVKRSTSYCQVEDSVKIEVDRSNSIDHGKPFKAVYYSNRRLYVEFWEKVDEHSSLLIHNVAGAEVERELVGPNNGSHIMGVNKMPSGIYLLELRSEQETLGVRKFYVSQ